MKPLAPLALMFAALVALPGCSNEEPAPPAPAPAAAPEPAPTPGKAKVKASRVQEPGGYKTLP